MKLENLTLGPLAAVAAFLIGIIAYAAVGFALSLMPRQLADSEMSMGTISEFEPSAAVPVPAEPIFAGPSAEEGATEKKYEADDFNWTGEYYLYGENLSRAFSDVRYLEIQTHEYTEKAGENGPYWRPIVPKGAIQTKIPLKFDRIAIGQKQLSFETATINGVSYKFIGRFLEDEDSDYEKDLRALTGRLIKIKDNKWAAEMEAEFYVSGC